MLVPKESLISLSSATFITLSLRINYWFTKRVVYIMQWHVRYATQFNETLSTLKFQEYDNRQTIVFISFIHDNISCQVEDFILSKTL